MNKSCNREVRGLWVHALWFCLSICITKYSVTQLYMKYHLLTHGMQLIDTVDRIYRSFLYCFTSYNCTLQFDHNAATTVHLWGYLGIDHFAHGVLSILSTEISVNSNRIALNSSPVRVSFSSSTLTCLSMASPLFRMCSFAISGALSNSVSNWCKYHLQVPLP